MPLQFRVQIARVEGGVHDAGFRRRLGAFSRQEDVSDLGLRVVGPHALVGRAAVGVEGEAVRFWRAEEHGERAGPEDADAGRWRGGVGGRLG